MEIPAGIASIISARTSADECFAKLPIPSQGYFFTANNHMNCS
jgi:hypothetical protein